MELSDWLTITSQILLLILTSRVYYNLSYRATGLNEDISDASLSKNNELIVLQLIKSQRKMIYLNNIDKIHLTTSYR